MFCNKKFCIRLMLCTTVFILMSISAVFAANTEILKVDFENVSYENFQKLDSVTIKPGIASDELSIEEESNGNMAFRINREASEVEDNTTQLGFNYKLPVTLTSGKVNVSFKIKAENIYRSRWRDLGSAMTSEGKRNLFLFTHSTWAWAQSTGSGFWYSNISTPDVWYEVKYELDIDNKSMVVGAGEVGTTISTKEKTCSGGDFASLEFTIGKQHNSWTSSNSGELIYWIDDIVVTVNAVNVVSTSIDGDETQVTVDKPLDITLDEIISDDKLNDDVFVLKSGKDSLSVNINKKSDKVIEIEPENGFDYNKEYTLIVKTGLLSDVALPDYEKTFKTLSIIDCDIVNDKRYNEGYLPTLNKVSDITYNAEISIDGGEYTAYNFINPFVEEGEYKLKITAEDINGKKQIEEYNFTVIGATAPFVDGEVTITGKPVVRTKLIASYNFKDENEDEQDMGKTVHQWYRVDKEGKQVPVGENSKEYILSEDDEDCYIKFTVIPYSVKEPYEGELFESELFTGPMNPTVSDIKITGDIEEGSELNVTYLHYDENEDTEIKEGHGKTVITWYAVGEDEDKKIGEGETYTLQKNDNDCLIKVGIIPKNNGSGKQDNEFFSGVFSGAFSPVAENVKITGTLKAGNIVGVNYLFTDKNEDKEGSTVIEWYVGGKLVSKEASYKISSSDAGKSIYAAVTPYSTVRPYEGKTVKSSVLTIEKKSNQSYTSGGGGDSSVVAPVIKPDTNNADSNNSEQNGNPDNEQNNDMVVFKDISGHWAEDEIKKMADKGILNGKGDEKFSPDDSVTRAELAAIIARAFDLSGSTNKFSDVTDNAWYMPYICAVSEMGYINGADGLYRPDDTLTRQEIAVVLMNISKGRGMEKTSHSMNFTDSNKCSAWAKEAIDFVSSLGLMNGVGDNNFDPTGYVTRAQAAVILSRIAE